MISSKPSQYIKGWVEFYKLKFKVTPDVLIPRPETELLVDEVINFIKDIPSTSLREYSLSESQTSRSNQSLTILDIGTGSGNISISIAKNTKEVKLVGTDISSKALKVAKQNAKFHGVQDRITFIQSNLLIGLPRPDSIGPRNDGSVLVIVTNLPYIPSARIPYLDCSVKDFEPLVALDGGKDGFELYRKLFKQINDKKIKFRLLIGEIDYTHGQLAVNEALKFFPNAQVEVKTDLTHKQRILKIETID